jgi:hypothetical protein
VHFFCDESDSELSQSAVVAFWVVKSRSVYDRVFAEQVAK